MGERTSHEELDWMPDVDSIMREAKHGRGEQKMLDALSRDTPAPPLTDTDEDVSHLTSSSRVASTSKSGRAADERRATTDDEAAQARSAPLVPRRPMSFQRRLGRLGFAGQLILGVGAVAAPCILMFVLLVWKRDERSKDARINAGDRAPVPTTASASASPRVIAPPRMAPSADGTSVRAAAPPSASTSSIDVRALPKQRASAPLNNPSLAKSAVPAVPTKTQEPEAPPPPAPPPSAAPSTEHLTDQPIY